MMSVKVMIVDNVQLRREAAEDAFRKAGFEVCSASDSLGCALTLSAECPDLLILETKLPIAGGFQILQSLRKREQTRAIPVILLADEAELESLSGTGSDARELYLARPASPATLVAVATQMLANGEWHSAEGTDSPPRSGEEPWGDRWVRRGAIPLRDAACPDQPPAKPA
jgi:CheY-like chemotaxis protein